MSLLLTFAEAETLGHELHDRWDKMAGEVPLRRDDLAWADIVQFILRKAGEAIAQREAAMESGDGR